MLICRHCRKSIAKKPRQLCYTCYAKMHLRLLYPSLSVFGKRWHVSEGATVTAACLPPAPTTALPGTLSKVEVMAERAKNGQLLFHPQDAQR